MLTRRSILGLAAAGALLPGRALAAKPLGRRNLLFVFAPGGWDTTYALSPLFDNPHVDMPDDSEPATIAGFSLVDSPERPSVRAFFESWGGRTLLLHGLSIPSVAHDVCRRIVMTGSHQATREDWGTLVAGASGSALSMPMLHLAGPLYADEHASSVIRVGTSGQLGYLLDGSALGQSDQPVAAPGADRRALELAFVRARAAAAVGTAGDGWARRMADAHALAMERLQAMLDLPDLELAAGPTLGGQGTVAASCFEAGLSRCAMLAYDGLGWDTHSENFKQSDNFENLFAGLLTILDELASRRGETGSLLDDTTVVVLSEMGRYPQLNGTDGKDHWPWTSALLVGGGVAGGRTIGGWTDGVSGEPVDLASGDLADDGVILGAEHLGATLLALGDLDPADYLEDPAPIGAVLA